MSTVTGKLVISEKDQRILLQNWALINMVITTIYLYTISSEVEETEINSYICFAILSVLFPFILLQLCLKYKLESLTALYKYMTYIGVLFNIVNCMTTIVELSKTADFCLDCFDNQNKTCTLDNNGTVVNITRDQCQYYIEMSCFLVLLYAAMISVSIQTVRWLHIHQRKKIFTAVTRGSVPDIEADIPDIEADNSIPYVEEKSQYVPPSPVVNNPPAVVDSTVDSPDLPPVTVNLPVIEASAPPAEYRGVRSASGIAVGIRNYNT
tara:strand:- start:9592 stop:10389 length:798 start_codon:yes stop_codon:yes gene_type:complete